MHAPDSLFGRVFGAKTVYTFCKTLYSPHFHRLSNCDRTARRPAPFIKYGRPLCELINFFCLSFWKTVKSQSERICPSRVLHKTSVTFPFSARSKSMRPPFASTCKVLCSNFEIFIVFPIKCKPKHRANGMARNTIFEIIVQYCRLSGNYNLFHKPSDKRKMFVFNIDLVRFKAVKIRFAPENVVRII